MFNNKKEVKICASCQKEIDEKLRYTHFEVWINKKRKEEYWFHDVCWGQFINNEVTKRLKSALNISVKHLAPMLKNLGVA